MFRDNIWRLYRPPESMVSDRRLQFAVEMTRELNKILRIEKKLFITLHP